MFVLAELLKSIGLLVSIIFNILYFILVIRIIISWVGADPYNEIVRIVYKITDPLLAPFRALPLRLGAIDFTPIVAFLVLSILKSFIVNIIYQIAYKIG